MKRRGCIFNLYIILVALAMTRPSVLSAQEPTSTQIPIDTDMVIVFPSLDCNDIESPFVGPTWNGITVGLSTINDLKNYVTELSTTYSENSVVSLQITEFTVRSTIAETEGIPALIYACVNPDNERITAIYVPTPIWFVRIHVQDLVSMYGSPDLVLWDEILSSRVVVWLTEGIAASVSVDASEQFVPYGTITAMTYFPYQSLEGYEERWPYTHRAAPRPELVTLTPDLPHITNPFDFDAMIATITAEPSRTPTSTFAPPHLTPTATPPPSRPKAA